MSSSPLVDKIQNSLMTTKQLQYKLFHNCILAIEKGDVKKVETCLSLYPNLPKDVRWANKNTRIPSRGVMQLCIPLIRALCPQQMTNEHHKIVKILLKNGSDPLRPATEYFEGCRIIDKAIQEAFLDENRANLKLATSPQRKVLHELFSWVSENHNIDEVLSAKDAWRKACSQLPQLCTEILNDAKNTNTVKSVWVENNSHQPQEEPYQIIRRLKI